MGLNWHIMQDTNLQIYLTIQELQLRFLQVFYCSPVAFDVKLMLNDML